MPQSNSARQFYNSIAPERAYWREKNLYYHEDLESFVAQNRSTEDTLLEIGCGLGNLVGSLESPFAVGVDFSDEMIKRAREKHPNTHFVVGDAENLPLNKVFDTIVISDTIGLVPDVQKIFEQLKPLTANHSRVLITYYNYLWEPLFKLLEFLRLKMPQPTQNWLSIDDIENLLYLSGFEVIRKGQRLLFPKKIKFLSTFLNRFVSKLPLIRRLCLVEWLIAKPIAKPMDEKKISCSVVIPCRNERDNIPDAVYRTPQMGGHMELIFVDGSSNDGTVEEIERMQRENPDKDIQLIHQGDGVGKYDAVKKGFAAAKGDVLMILDSDLTVPPEDLPKFFNALLNGQGEFINGSRLVYPMEKQAMRLLNLFGNKFFGKAFSYLLDQRFTDTLCGTKVLWRHSYSRIEKGRAYFGDFDPFGDFDLIFGAAKQNLKIVELPIRYRERTYGITKIRRFYHGMILLKMCWVAIKKLKFV